MLRSRLLIFPALVAAHAAATFFSLICALYGHWPEWPAGVMLIPLLLLSQASEDHDHLPDLGALVGIPEDSPLSPFLVFSVNCLLWVAGAYGVWLAGRWAWRKAVHTSDQPA